MLKVEFSWTATSIFFGKTSLLKCFVQNRTLKHLLLSIINVTWSPKQKFQIVFFVHCSFNSWIPLSSEPQSSLLGSFSAPAAARSNRKAIGWPLSVLRWYLFDWGNMNPVCKNIEKSGRRMSGFRQPPKHSKNYFKSQDFGMYRNLSGKILKVPFPKSPNDSLALRWNFCPWVET